MKERRTRGLRGDIWLCLIDETLGTKYKRCLGVFKWNYEFGLDLNRITKGP